MTQITSFSILTDHDLIAEVKRLAHAERGATAALVASLAEMDARKLYLGEGCSSVFTYCTRVLHLSEHAAYGRIEAARAARRFPVVLERLESGELTLSNLSLVRPHLTDENCLAQLDAVRFASKRDVERLVAAMGPQPDVAAMIRKLPNEATRLTRAVHATPVSDLTPEASDVAGMTVAIPPAPPVTPRRPAVVVRALAPERYRIQLTVNQETHDKLRRVQDLLRHVILDGDLAMVFDRALTALLREVERSKLSVARQPRPARPVVPGSRHVPAAVRRAVWQRDEGRCAFEGREGRCAETAFLEFHHILPFARGGRATVENIQLRCRAHNQYQAIEDFGPRALIVREAASIEYLQTEAATNQVS
jgi:hypothetical protein